MNRNLALRRRLPGLLAVLLLVVPLGRDAGLHAAHPVQAPGPAESRIDEAFARWTSATPGCSIGVSRDGRSVFEKGYGMADLEHDIPNTAATIFEAGSVSKQFTAAAVLLLVRDGKLSLDDPVRKYLTELPDYGGVLTIRHMLTHTAGLRDWGTLAGIAGWPRTTRVYTQAHVLEIARRQRALNFAPGTNWSYSNTGYNLAAILVSRVSGQAFAEFCRLRLFEPLGMTHTSWRDDYTRIVKGRAVAYSQRADGYHQDMPFENVHGNGGLLTTVGDLLRWNMHLDEASGDDAKWVHVQQTPATLKTGETLDYALGFYVRKYKGLTEIGHSGSTAGYRAFVARYPERKVSVAVLCNGSTATAERDARTAADFYLGLADPSRPLPVPGRPAGAVPPSFGDVGGLYRSVLTGVPLSIVWDKNAWRLEDGPPLVPVSPQRLAVPDTGRAIDFGEGGPVVRYSNGLSERYERVAPARPGRDELQAVAGTYASDEAEVELEVVAQKGRLTLLRRPNTAITLKPLYADSFAAPGLGTIRFHRQGGRVAEMSIIADRVWDLRLRRR